MVTRTMGGHSASIHCCMKWKAVSIGDAGTGGRESGNQRRCAWQHGGDQLCVGWASIKGSAQCITSETAAASIPDSSGERGSSVLYLGLGRKTTTPGRREAPTASICRKPWVP
eukprot:TRINITY_DN12010_c0_g1_i4.p2 TRINITY_DN12010_c0_g1~~TRINITY_DN12010_c0_g1_i4.p2  ORF type:complete len:113 (-),score=3.02 TRINITY_DN12010_c0_g1_i4:153-491(-)